jgi:hypothetical protein
MVKAISGVQVRIFSVSPSNSIFFLPWFPSKGISVVSFLDFLLLLAVTQYSPKLSHSTKIYPHNMISMVPCWFEPCGMLGAFHYFVGCRFSSICRSNRPQTTHPRFLTSFLAAFYHFESLCISNQNSRPSFSLFDSLLDS